ncbi:energy transducer TonB [Mucilaginibacter jinjuensis]|uniref:Energy transducer TonB n=1 Tax=Mucilaginibacter jinjuensis TaxID=1176721 RepID=A0ABY7T5T9_9SPHI|nr:energy transducer TonB [Mucilaginibacter jinjuensis]WCT11614.1 energy transducer TonB [Mucilaginibacter jinjuensis]
MKTILVFVLLLFILSACHAQFIPPYKPKYKIVKQDTINIRGIVLDILNNPVTELQIRSKNKHYFYEGLNPYTYTDKQGRFELRGALINDTLDCFRLKKMSVINNGSRYLEIHLPLLTTDTSRKPSAEVTAKRVKKRTIPTFNVITNSDISDYYGVAGDMIVNSDQLVDYPKYLDSIKLLVHYPEKAIKNNIEGTVIIGFDILKDEQFDNFKIIRGIGYDCDEAVITAIKNGPKRHPGINNGRPVKSQSSVTINFKLTDK